MAAQKPVDIAALEFLAQLVKSAITGLKTCGIKSQDDDGVEREGVQYSVCLETLKLLFKQVECVARVLPRENPRAVTSYSEILLPLLPNLQAEVNQSLEAKDKEIASLREKLEAKDKELAATKQKLEQCLARESEHFSDEQVVSRPQTQPIQTEIVDQIEGEADTGEHTLRSALAKPIEGMEAAPNPKSNAAPTSTSTSTSTCTLSELQVLHRGLQSHLEVKDVKALIPAIQSDTAKRFIANINLPVSTLDPKICKARLLPGRDREWILDVAGALLYQLEKAIAASSSKATAQVGKETYSPF